MLARVVLVDSKLANHHSYDHFARNSRASHGDPEKVTYLDIIICISDHIIMLPFSPIL